jgi:hypothetical protein
MRILSSSINGILRLHFVFQHSSTRVLGAIVLPPAGKLTQDLAQAFPTEA